MRSWSKFVGMPVTAIVIAACAGVPAFAGTNPWFGTWKMDTAKSHLAGGTFSYTKESNGLDQYSNGVEQYDFTANGHDYPVMGGETESWSFTGPDAWKVTDKQNGKVVSTSDVKLSANCRTMTVTVSGTMPDGSAMHEEDVYTREKPGSGCLEGTWKNTKVSDSTPGEMAISAGPQAGEWKWEIPAWKETVEGKPDGSDLSISGPEVPSGTTVAFRQENSHKMHFEVKENGKTLEEGDEMLSGNGREMTSTSWTPGQENEKTTAVYLKEK